MRVTSLLAVVLGEAAYILGEMQLAAQQVWSLPALACMIFGALSLAYGYMYGTKVWGIWVTGVVSSGSIVIIEPLLAYLFFRTIPQGRIMLGVVLSIVAMVISII